jgi:hypothetical protein
VKISPGNGPKSSFGAGIRQEEIDIWRRQFTGKRVNSNKKIPFIEIASSRSITF